jgi:hypothetical protein
MGIPAFAIPRTHPPPSVSLRMLVCSNARVLVCSCARMLVCSCARVLECSCARVFVCSCARVLDPILLIYYKLHLLIVICYLLFVNCYLLIVNFFPIFAPPFIENHAPNEKYIPTQLLMERPLHLLRQRERCGNWERILWSSLLRLWLKCMALC